MKISVKEKKEVVILFNKPFKTTDLLNGYSYVLKKSTLLKTLEIVENRDTYLYWEGSIVFSFLNICFFSKFWKLIEDFMGDLEIAKFKNGVHQYACIIF